MTLILRKCWKDAPSRNNFFYGQVGERVNCPDWNPNPICGNGLHGLKEGNGLWALLEGNDWLVIDADDQIVDIDDEKCKFNTGVILFRGTAKELEKSNLYLNFKLDINNTIKWFHEIGNKKEILTNLKCYNANILYDFLLSLNLADRTPELLEIIRSKIIKKLSNSVTAFFWLPKLSYFNFYIGENKIEDKDIPWTVTKLFYILTKLIRKLIK